MGLKIGDLVTHIIHRNGLGIVVKVKTTGSNYPYCIHWASVNASLFAESWYKKESLVRV